jgi:hypothetical protein
MLYDREKQKGNANRATLAVARKLVAYLVAVDRRQKDFLTVEREHRTAAQAPEARIELFRDWQESTNSIFC